MKLFEILPEKFFHLFSGKNRLFYAEAVLLLYEQYQIHRFGIQYEIMRDLFQELIETREEAGLRFDLEEEQEQPGLTGDFDDLFRVKANALLRRLRETGWIDVEVRDGFRQYIFLPQYSSRILSVLKELCEERSVEYQRFAFITYQLLASDEAKKRPSFAILEADRLTQQFVEELRVLINNMKHHMDQLTRKTTVQEVLDHHFDEYKAKIVDRSYHRLKTSDHVSRYRQRILETVQKWLLDRDLFRETVEDSLRSEFFASRDEAEQKLRGALMSIEEVYGGLDEIFYQIDVRHNQYLRASFDRARYLSQQSRRIDHLLARVLKWVSENGRRDGDGAPVDAELSLLFRLQQVTHLTEQSLFAPRKKPAQHQPEVHKVPEIPEEVRKQLRENSVERLRKVVTREKIREYVYGRLGNRTEMGIEELAPKNMEEFIYLAYVYLYGYEESSGYRLVKEGFNRVLSIGDYRFYDRKVIRTKKQKGVK
ncbi:MAG: Wadjet anti-phage system protein JetA family protein [Bacillota bacterium]